LIAETHRVSTATPPIVDKPEGEKWWGRYAERWGCTPPRRWGHELTGDNISNGFCSGSIVHDSDNGYICGYPLPTSNGYGFRYVIKVTDIDIQSHE
jgi:hypothetical protein